MIWFSTLAPCFWNECLAIVQLYSTKKLPQNFRKTRRKIIRPDFFLTKLQALTCFYRTPSDEYSWISEQWVKVKLHFINIICKIQKGIKKYSTYICRACTRGFFECNLKKKDPLRETDKPIKHRQKC